MEDLSTAILLYLYMFGIPIIMVVSLILGIVIICTKEKITKLFGVTMTIGSISGILSVLYKFGLRLFGSMETVATYADVYSYVSIALGIASGVFLYLYAKNRYGTNLITGIILIVGGNTVSTVINVIFAKIFSVVDFENPAQYSYLLTAITNILVIAFPIVWLIIFFKNRHKENELKFLWLERILPVASMIFNLGLSLYMFFALNGTTSNREIYVAQNSNDVRLIVSSLIFDILHLVICIYIVVKGRKASEDKEPEVV